MEIGVISDIHGNKVAFDAVLTDMPSVDGIVCAGDVVGYNPWHGKCVEMIRKRSIPTVSGNHDRAVAGGERFAFNSIAGAGVAHARETLTDEQIAWLDGLPDRKTAFEGKISLAHGHPEHPDRYTYPEEFDPAMLSGEQVLVLGHTHIQGHRVFEEGIVMNPGSVGQPRDGDPRAAYAVVDLADNSVREHRVAYDIDRVKQAVEEADLPERIGTRLEDGN